MSNLYAENPKVHGRCSVCGATGLHTHKGKGRHKNKDYPTPFYSSVFEKVNWFRGDDEYVGKICRDCLKAGRISEANKQVNGLVESDSHNVTEDANPPSPPKELGK